MAYKMTKEEMETTITCNAKDRAAHVYTCDPVFIRKLDKLVTECGDAYKLAKADDWGGRYYEFDKKYIRFGRPASEAMREAGRKLARMNSELSRPSISCTSDESGSLDEKSLG